MKFLDDFDFKPLNILKVSGFFFVGLIIVIVAFNLVSATFGPLVSKNRGGSNLLAGAFQKLGSATTQDAYYGNDGDFGMVYPGEEVAELSIRNIAGSDLPYPTPGVPGNDAEEFEVKQYSASIESRNVSKTCGQIAGLKSLDYVIFENSNEYDRGCSYNFKVNTDNTDEILAVIEGLDPKDLSENISTIKRTLDDFTSEEEILENKLATIDETLEDAIAAYDSITGLATSNRDAESLANIITSKLEVVERLTREKINITTQLDYLNRAKTEQLDRLKYTSFYVNVYESKFVDGEYIKDSWKMAVKNAIRDINQSIQDITVNLIAVLFIAFQYALYLLILLVIVKYGWRLGKYIWDK